MSEAEADRTHRRTTSHPQEHHTQVRNADWQTGCLWWEVVESRFHVDLKSNFALKNNSMEFLLGPITWRINVLYESRMKWTWHHSKLLAVEEVSFFGGLRVVLLQLLSIQQWALRTWVWRSYDHITPWYLPKMINFICSVALNLRNKCTRVPLCVLDHPWRVFFHVRPGPCPSRIHAFSDFTWSVVYNAKTEIRLAGSVLRERFATIILLISIERMAYGYQSNMVCQGPEL